MIISIIAILLLAGKVLSSLSSLVQGSMTINDDTISLELRANKFNSGDDTIDETIARLQTAKTKPRIRLTLNLSGRIIEMRGGQDSLFDARFEKVTEANATNDFTNSRLSVLKEILCDTCDDNFARHKIAVSRLQVIDDISEILRYVTSAMQKRNDYKNLIHQDSIFYENLHNFKFIIPQSYQNSVKTPINPESVASSWSFSDNEKARLNARSKLLLEYIKEVQDGLSSLVRLFDVKWRQSYEDFDSLYTITSIRRLLSLQEQAEFLLENLIEENQRQRQETESKKYQDLARDRSASDVLNAEEIDKEEGMRANERDEKSFNKTDKIEEANRNEIRKVDYKLTTGQVTPKMETRIMNYPELLEGIKHDFKDKSSTTVRIDPIGQVSAINKFSGVKDNFILNNISPLPGTKVSRDKNYIVGKTSSVDRGNSNKFIEAPHNKSVTTGFQMENRFGRLKNRSTILPSENIRSTLKRMEKRKRARTNVTFLYESLRKNPTRIPSRRMMQNVPIPSDKNEDRKEGNRHASKMKIADLHRVKVKTRMDGISAIDEILEAVDEVLPTESSVESPSSWEPRVTPLMSDIYASKPETRNTVQD